MSSSLGANVIIFDWSEWSDENYFCIVTKLVGKLSIHLANVTQTLVKAKISQSKIKYVGHNVGAHIISVASRKLTKKIENCLCKFHSNSHLLILVENIFTKLNIFYLVLDAARQYYSSPFGPYLHKTDCKRTVAVQTNQGDYGLTGSYAAVNIKPNGGKTQLNCDKIKQPLCDTYFSLVVTETAIKSSGSMYAKHKLTQALFAFLNFDIPDGDYTMETPKCYNDHNSLY